MTSILNADLHCHSVVSDGTLTPEDLAAGTYDQLEGLQGERHTLWVGNTLAYELGVVRIGRPWRHDAAAGDIGVGHSILAGIGIGDQ